MPLEGSAAASRPHPPFGALRRSTVGSHCRRGRLPRHDAARHDIMMQERTAQEENLDHDGRLTPRKSSNMTMIFPGMDPYLEDSRLWAGVHGRLIVYIADQIGRQIPPRYATAVEERVYLEGPEREVRPDVSVRRTWLGGEGPAIAVAEPDSMIEVWAPQEPIREGYVTILDLLSGQRIVTVIEVVSPTNKYAGAGRDSYLAKQEQILQSDAHLVEIDLLRHGQHVLCIPEYKARDRGYYDYLVCVNRARDHRARYELYPRRLADRLPRIRIPLAGDDPDVVLDVQAVLEQTYEAGRYRDRINYSKPCEPPLTVDQQNWANSQIQTASQR
jgi:hypothetical protein